MVNCLVMKQFFLSKDLKSYWLHIEGFQFLISHTNLIRIILNYIGNSQLTDCLTIYKIMVQQNKLPEELPNRLNLGSHKINNREKLKLSENTSDQCLDSPVDNFLHQWSKLMPKQISEFFSLILFSLIFLLFAKYFVQDCLNNFFLITHPNLLE